MITIAELTVTTELLVFIGVILSALISVLLYLFGLDRRITVLESRTITREEFFAVKEDIIKAVKEEIKDCRLRNKEEE